MAKYRMVAALFAPSGNYDETTDPKAVADYMALDMACESYDFDSMASILSNYEVENGAIEEHNSDSDLVVYCDADGYYLLTKISE